MQFESNRCYSTVLHFAASGTRLLYQQSPELLAKAVSAQTVLPGTKSCSQTSCYAPCHVPALLLDIVKGVYCKGRVPHTTARLSSNTGFIMDCDTTLLLNPDKPPNKQHVSS